MPSQLTVTAKTGPAVQATATVLADVSGINFNLNNRVVQVAQNNGANIKEYDLVGVTTVTFTVSGSNYTMVIS
jgi:hypothetical protein